MISSLNRLRLRLTLLFLGAALVFMLLLGGGIYYGLQTYFASVTDEALEHKMVHEFQLLGAELPPALAAADRDWSIKRAGMFSQETSDQKPERSDEGEGATPTTTEHDSDDRRAAEVAYNGEIAGIFVFPLSAQGRLLVDLPPPPPPISPDNGAVTAALDHGNDWRTVLAPDGSRVRLLTYRLTRPGEPSLLQLGRTLSDQERVLGQMLAWFATLGGAGVIVLSGCSWWIAGRSLRPAQAAWERQQVFVANASHELRTPLTLMRASVEVAQRGLPAADARRELLADTLAECDHMSRLVEDLLLLSRLDAGRLPLHIAHVDALALLADIERQLRPLADSAGVALSIAGADNVAALADAARLRQILLILIDNALRYTPRGGSVSITATRAESRGEMRALFEVIDSGVGIALAHQGHVFERFWRADSTNPNCQNGSGLGLAIARQLVEAQHGAIGVASSPGQGSRFFFTLPLA